MEGIAGPFLRQQAFLCAVRMCFSGAEFASHGRDLAAFDPERVRAELYPSRVLDRLAEAVPAGFFAEQLDAFLRAAHPPGIVEAIAAACAEHRRDADFFGSLWIAQLNTHVSPLPPTWADWTLWQFRDGSVLDPRSADWDWNRFHGTAEDLKREWPFTKTA